MMMCFSWFLIPFLLLAGMATETFGSRQGLCRTRRATTRQVQCSTDDDCPAPKKCCPTKGDGAKCEIPATNCRQLNCSRCEIDPKSGFALCAVDGNWGEWGSYGPCSATCEGGTQERTRACDNPPPANGGADCKGDNTQTQACSTDPCRVPSNVALWKPATESSVYELPHLSLVFSADLAVDGDNNTDLVWGRSCTHTQINQVTGSWWQVDLQGLYIVHSVIITNRGDCCGDMLRDFTVRVYNEDPTVNSLAVAIVCHHYMGPMELGVTEELPCCKPVTGRFLRITKPNMEHLSLCEVQVMAVPLI